MKSIFFITLHLGCGGIEKSVANTANFLCKKYDVTIVSIYKLLNKPFFEIDDRVKIIYLCEKIKPNREEFKSAIKKHKFLLSIKEAFYAIYVLIKKRKNVILFLKQLKCNIIISDRLYFNKLIGKYLKNKEITKIAVEHNHHNHNSRNIKSVISSCKNIDYLLPVSLELTNFYKVQLKNYNNQVTKCKFIEHSIGDFSSEKSSLEHLNIVSTGRLSSEKGFNDLINIFSNIKKKRPTWTLTIIGDGPELSNLLKQVTQLGLEDFVIFTGFIKQEEIIKQYQLSSIYVMTSHYESFGLVLIEAASLGLPLVAYDSAQGASEIISDEYNGYLIQNRDKEQMESKLIELIDNKDLRMEIGNNAKKFSQKYDKKEIEKKWINFIDSLYMK